MTQPIVSVVMSVYNGSRFVRAAIQSILNQTFRDFEFIIVDDCSTDETPEIVRSYGDSRICLIVLPENRGMAAALNYGIQHVRGEFIARIDSDDVSEPGRLKSQVAFLRDHPDVALLGTWNTVIDSEGRLRGRSEYPVSHEQIVERLVTRNCFCHSSVMVRTDVVRACGGYRGFRISQDYDLWTRIAERYRVANLPEYMVAYRVLHNSLSRAGRTRQQAAQSAIVGYLHRERMQGRPDPLDRLPLSEHQRWIEQHAHLVRKQAREKRRENLALMMHYALGESSKRKALGLAGRGICNFPADPLFWRFLYYHGAPRFLRAMVGLVGRTFRVFSTKHD